jgi:predicted RNA-binding Zn ribbon-like protein
MLMSEVLRSCAHRNVAEAAILSIGGDFATMVRERAEHAGQSVGDFTAARVQQFSMQASERDRHLVTAQMRGEDLALLSGLRVVVQRMMQGA